MNQKTEGLYDKFTVKRNDGRDKPGQDRAGAYYFILDVTYDPHAVAALRAYAKSCRNDYPKLADDIYNMIGDV